ncbi:hypothetical protein BTS2_1464 [Bacillus sp. TS-2]|nr:hypothetical protein BTS2_1464 [Bacillus sp. TS-2]
MKQKSFLIKPEMNKQYKKITHGRGVYLFDENGKAYLDGSSGAITVNLGHNVNEIKKAINAQANKVSFVYRSQFTTNESEQLASKINGLFSFDEDFYSFFVNSGSEATETAIKMAIQYWQDRNKPTKQFILSRWFSYHGITRGALSLSGYRKRRERFEATLEKSPQLEAPYCYRCPFQLSYPKCNVRCAYELDTVIHKMGSTHIAAFIAEPIVGAAGAALTPPKEYYSIISAICQKHQILFIADEVMTGIGRTGDFLAIDHWQVKPDIIILGKGLGAGFTSIAAACISESLYSTLARNSGFIMSGHTYSANPQSTATAFAVLEYIENEQLLKQVQKKGEYLMTKLTKLLKPFDIVGDIRGKGLLIGVELVEERSTKKMFPRQNKVLETLLQIAEEEGLLLYPAQAGNGVRGDAFLIAPPYIISYSEMNLLLRKIVKTLERLSSPDKKEEEDSHDQ